MIGWLAGTIVDRSAGGERTTAEVIINVNGVGYRATVTAAASADLVPGRDVELFIHHHYWEADQRLFAFHSREERDAFEGLLGAHKVGPALALAVIATHSPVRLASILANDDIDALCEVPGVGKKTAQRLLVDLKSTLVLPVLDTDSGQPIDLTGAAPSPVEVDVKDAMANLGYSNDEITQALNAVSVDGRVPDDVDAGALLKLALRAIAGG